ncbi:MAG TPA: AAA family ATPase [Armatimonadota bacterium]|nr:AAA family ATPase [Armatimonadota bacterium]
MSKGIDRLSIRRFRGATTSTELQFDQSKLVAMIFGENGSGKTTIIDAIDLVCNQTAGSLDGRSSTSAKDHLPAIGSVSADIEVELSCGGKIWTGTHSGRKAVVKGSNSPPQVHILRRSRLLRMDENQRASLLQSGYFEGHSGVPPQAYFSEAHLDTFGFCLFLSLARPQSGGDAVIILDDVFSSVDQAHLARIIDRLADESKFFNQIIITTHYRQWRDRYRYLKGPGGSVDLIELHGWSNQGGIRHHRTQLAAEELATLLQADPFSRQAAALQAGILLEAALDHLTLLYRCRVPRTVDGGYTIGELCDAASKLARAIEIVRPTRGGDGVEKTPPETEKMSLKTLLEALASTAFIRNSVGCHFNASGADIADDDVRRFVQQTLDLVSVLVCAGCGELAQRPKGTHYECRCGKLQMAPLQFQS